MHFARGIVTADVSGRYYVHNNPLVLNPDVFQSGFVYFSKPFYQAVQYQNQTFGARLSLEPTQWWMHIITVGLDRSTTEGVQTQPRLTTPGDTLLSLFNSSRTKTSIGYNTSVHGTLGSRMSGSLTVGVDHYWLPVTSWSTSGAVNTTGAIRTDSSQPVSAYRTITNNTGYFAQLQLGFRDALFLTTGVRAEQNSDFGASLGTPVSPRVGLSYVRNVGGATLKFRGSWGRAIRPPAPESKSAAVYPYEVILANPNLGPERQKGADVGVDAVYASRGSLSVTYYNQTAEDLIDFVLVSGGSVPTYQYQNVGRVKNTGVEVAGTLFLGVVQAKAQYGYARARVEQLAPNYSGDLRVGDQVPVTPKHTAGGSLTLAPHTGMSVAAGLTYVGSYSQYDVLSRLRCIGGTGPCQPTSRDYIIAYPSFVKVNATISQQITPLVSGFVSIDNLTNRETPEYTNFSSVVGRITTVGFRFRH